MERRLRPATAFLFVIRQFQQGSMMVVIPNLIRSTPEGDKFFIRTIPFYSRRGGKSQEDDPSFPAPAAGEEINGGRLSSLPEEREGRAASSQPLCPWSCGTFSASPDRPDGPLRGGLPFPRSGCTCKVEGCGQQSPPLPEIEDAIFWHGSSSQISP